MTNRTPADQLRDAYATIRAIQLALLADRGCADFHHGTMFETMINACESVLPLPWKRVDGPRAPFTATEQDWIRQWRRKTGEILVEDHEIPNAPLDPWVPMTEPIDIKHMGKFGEETAEAATIACRCIIQGIYGAEPKTGKLNVTALEDEIADVLANVELVSERFKLDMNRITARAVMKKARLRLWHAGLLEEKNV
jgi:hypothetical protein